jgi:D-threo-aldose 1-dehydrogenase
MNDFKREALKRTVLLPANIQTSRLGFGCVQLTAHDSRREALSVLEHAFSLGITHFDVARGYGFGRAEKILGEFLRHKRQHVTVTTKFGIEPPSGLMGNARVLDALKRILRPFPWLLQRAKNRGSAMVKTRVFTPEAAIRNLETSLRELGTDYVDIFLLHEATVEDASNPLLLEVLLGQVEKGKIRHIGVGSAFDKIQGNVDRLPSAYEILQFNDNVVNRSVRTLRRRDRELLITHSIFTPAALLLRAAKAHPQITNEYSALMGIDLAEPSSISSLLFRFALRSNFNGIVLFSSRDPQHITRNVREAELDLAEHHPSDVTQVSQFIEFANQLLAA